MKLLITLICCLLLTGCDGKPVAKSADSPPASPSVDLTRPGGPVVGVEGPLYMTHATVLQESARPELCVGLVRTSLPPQCGGPPIVNWDWDDVDWEESANGVIWGDYEVVGRYDGKRFAVVDVEPDEGKYRVEPEPAPPEPERGYSHRELRSIQLEGAEILDRFGAEMVTSSVVDDHVEYGVVIATDEMRDAFAQEYGKGAVVLVPAMRRVVRRD